MTRPVEDCARTADALRAAGHKPLITPLFEIRPITHAEPEFGDAILATSANALRHARISDRQKLLPLLAVGDATAAEAHRLGFADVQSSRGDSRDLAEMAANRLGKDASLLYITGIPRRDEALLLLANRFELHVVETYETVAVDSVPGDLRQILAEQAVDAVLHFSPRAATVFRDLSDAAGFATQINRILHVFISKAAELTRFPLRRVADRPNLASMIAALHDG